MSNKLEKFKEKQKRDIPDIDTGDKVRVKQKLKIGGKEKDYVSEGLVIARKHGNEPSATITIRETIGDYGMEKIIPLHSPNIEELEVLQKGNAQKSKLYYLRDKSNKEIRRKIKAH